jgi:hypothetical protein
MSDFFSPENDDDQFARFGELDNLEGGKSSKWRAATIVSVLVTVLVVVAVAAGAYFYVYPMVKKNLNKQGTSEKSAGLANDNRIVQDLNDVNGSLQKEVELKPVSNILIVGVDSVGGKQLARGLLVGRFDLKKKDIQAINISERTYYNIDGLGLDQINKVYSMGMTATKQTIQSLLRVPIDGHIVLDYNDFQFMVSENRFRVGFSKAIELSYTNDEKKAFMKAISSMDPSKSNILPLPVQYISVNGEPFFEPDEEALGKLLDSLWGVKIEVKSKPLKVLVLNGNGAPGIGKTVSDQLSTNGYIVDDVRNASNFNIKTTSIIVYRESFVEKAKALKNLIGVGSVVVDSNGASSNVVDIVVIVGHDYKPVSPSATTTTSTTVKTTATTVNGSTKATVKTTPATTTTTTKPKTTTTTTVKTTVTTVKAGR